MSDAAPAPVAPDTPISEPKVLVVITSYQRAYNLPAVIKAWWAQSHRPAWLVVVDNAPRRGHRQQYQVVTPAGAVFREHVLSESYPDHNLQGADDVWRMSDNLGCACHYAPALMYGTRFPYTLFADDDFLPGKQALEWLVGAVWKQEDQVEKGRITGRLLGNFASLGEVGRHFKAHDTVPKRWQYRYGNSPRRAAFNTPAHITCRSSLVYSQHLPQILLFRERLIALYGEEARRLCMIHDDMLTCLGLQTMLGLPSLVTPIGPDETKLIHTQLPEDGAIWKRPEHLAERNRFIEMAQGAGWKEIL